MIIIVAVLWSPQRQERQSNRRHSGMRGNTAVRADMSVMLSEHQASHVALMFYVNRLSDREREIFVFSFSSPNRPVNLSFMEIKYGRHPPLPASRWSLWRESDYLAHLRQGTWECWCWVGSAVPRQASCPQEPEYDLLYLPAPPSPTVSGPHPPSSNLPPARLTAPLSPPPSQTPLPLLWDRLSPTWQGLAWISGIPGQVGLMRKVLSAWACLDVRQRREERARS